MQKIADVLHAQIIREDQLTGFFDLQPVDVLYRGKSRKLLKALSVGSFTQTAPLRQGRNAELLDIMLVDVINAAFIGAGKGKETA